jgi:hypothetical protein
MRWFATVTALMLAAAAMSGDAAPPETNAEDIDTSDTRIGIGRLDVINDFTAQIWQKMRAGNSGGSHYTLRQLNSSLRSSVWEYNRLREELCNDRFIVEQSCGAPFLPKWALDPKRNAMTLDELDTREADLEVHVVALWDAACARLEKVISWDDSRPYCSIE